MISVVASDDITPNNDTSNETSDQLEHRISARGTEYGFITSGPGVDCVECFII